MFTHYPRLSSSSCFLLEWHCGYGKQTKKTCSKLAIFRWRKITTINNAKIVHNNKTNNNERIFQQNQKQ